MYHKSGTDGGFVRNNNCANDGPKRCDDVVDVSWSTDKNNLSNHQVGPSTLNHLLQAVSYLCKGTGKLHIKSYEFYLKLQSLQ